jgi:predicted dienelactone hydrolase
MRLMNCAAAGLALLGLTLSACDSKEPLPFEPAGPEAAPAPSEMGPYPVGVKTVVYTDESRQTPGREGPRTLVTEIWYPAAEAARDMPKRDYILFDEIPEDLRADFPDIQPEDLGGVFTEAVQDAPVRADGEKYPLIVFSHGKGGIRMQSTFYTVTLASHGYVVVSTDHEADTIPDLLREAMEGDVNLNTTVDSFIDRPLDVAYLITQMENLAEDDPLKAITDVETVGVTGHSFGALTSFRIAGLDSRVDAIVAHTPVGITMVEVELGIGVEDFGIPYMIQAGGMDETLPADIHAESVWEHMVPPRYYLMLNTAGHFTYSDLCVLDVVAINEAIPQMDVSNVLNDGCGEGNVSTEDAFPVINHYSIGFFNGYLRGSGETLRMLDEANGKALLPGSEIEFAADPK